MVSFIFSSNKKSNYGLCCRQSKTRKACCTIIRTSFSKMVYLKLNRKDTVINGTNTERLKEFQRQQLFTDVILLCEDKLYHAHKLVITSASNHSRMKMLFPNLNYSTVLMTGVSPHDVENLICFLYAGEVWIPVGELEGFLKAARILRIDRIEPTSEVDIPEDMLVKPVRGVDSSRPLKNLNQINVANTQPTPRSNVLTANPLDKENLPGPSQQILSRFSTPAQNNNNNNNKSMRLGSRNLQNSNSQNNSSSRVTGQRLTLSSRKRGREQRPEKFRDEPVESEDVHSFVGYEPDSNRHDTAGDEGNRNIMEDCSMNFEQNYQSPVLMKELVVLIEDCLRMDGQQKLPTGSWLKSNVANDNIQLEAAPAAEEEESMSEQTQRPKTPATVTKRKVLKTRRERTNKSKRFVTTPATPKKKKPKAKIVKDDDDQIDDQKSRLTREKLGRKCKRDTLWLQRQKLEGEVGCPDSKKKKR